MEKIKFFLLALIISCSATFLNAQENSDKIRLMYGGSAGIGYEVLTGDISNYIKNPFMLPISLDLMKKNLLIQLNLDGGFSKVKSTMNFPDGLSWNESDNAWHNYIGGNIGYGIINNENYIIIPVIGYSYKYISKKWWASSDIVQHEPEGNYLYAAAIIDFKLKKMESGNNKGKYAGYTGVRVTLGAYIGLGDAKPYPEYYNGSTVYFSIGIPVLSVFQNK